MKAEILNSPIEWQSSESVMFLNDRISLDERKKFENLYKKYDRPNHLWISSSGSTASASESAKLIALSKPAFLNSATAVNQHLGVQPGDRWAQVLPSFHVGGLAIFARAFLSQSEVISGLDSGRKWNPEVFVETLTLNSICFSSLVPSQVHDLVAKGLRAPGRLRAIVVGGGALAGGLYKSARDLGWPLLSSYGLTEACSQVATAELSTLALPTQIVPTPKVLSHLKLKVVDGRIQICGNSLLTGYAQVREGQEYWFEPVKDGWFATDDFGTLTENGENQWVEIYGRGRDFVKVLGEGVNLNKLRQTLSQQAGQEGVELETECTLIAEPHDRKQNQICFIYSEKMPLPVVNKIVAKYNALVAPFERIEVLRGIERIPRSDLGKILWEQIK